MKRWLRFNAVGVMGAAVQPGVLALLLRLHVHYLVATGMAIEIALLHNYSNGLMSLCSNLVLMRLFTGAMGWPPVPSNLTAITITSLLNFVMASRWVFTQGVVSSTRLPRGRAIM